MDRQAEPGQLRANLPQVSMIAIGYLALVPTGPRSLTRSRLSSSTPTSIFVRGRSFPNDKAVSEPLQKGKTMSTIDASEGSGLVARSL